MKNSTIAILFGATIISGIALLWWVFSKPLPDYSKLNDADVEHYWLAPDINRLPDNDSGKLIKYGRDIIINTAKYYGPKGTVIANHINGMNCQNCHLDAGTKIYGNNLSGVMGIYPKYRDILGAVEGPVERVEDCFTRSLAGKRIDTNSHEMKAIIAYMTWLSSNLKKGEKPGGVNMRPIELLDRPANPENGKAVFVNKCQSCHQADGQGLLAPDGVTYQYPPLWGPHAYNIGASFYRIERFAAFVKDNMPFGTSFTAPQLSTEESWDVAAYVNSQPHPFVDVKKDWPDISTKPMDNPHGPYADTFSAQQHKYGPFALIKAWKEEHKKKS